MRTFETFKTSVKKQDIYSGYRFWDIAFVVRDKSILINPCMVWILSFYGIKILYGTKKQQGQK